MAELVPNCSHVLHFSDEEVEFLQKIVTKKHKDLYEMFFKTIDSALNSVFSDFEDAIQYYTAQNHQISTIVTRNLKDYKADGIVVQTPEMFLCSAGLL